ncbi:MAG: redoxin family protein [Fimbriimonadales bacterium]
MVTLLAATMILSPVDGLAVGAQAVFEARSQPGAVVRSSSLTGKPSVILLWGPWSNGSARALVALSNLSKTQRKARFIALASWDEPKNVTSFLATVRGVDLEIWIDPAGKNATESIAVKAFKTRRFPSVYVLNSRQMVVGSFLGYKPGDDIAGLIDRAD